MKSRGPVNTTQQMQRKRTSDSDYTKNIQMQLRQTQTRDGSQEDDPKHIKITEYGYPSQTSFKENITDARDQRRHDRTPRPR